MRPCRWPWGAPQALAMAWPLGPGDRQSQAGGGRRALTYQTWRCKSLPGRPQSSSSRQSFGPAAAAAHVHQTPRHGDQRLVSEVVAHVHRHACVHVARSLAATPVLVIGHACATQPAAFQIHAEPARRRQPERDRSRCSQGAWGCAPTARRRGHPRRRRDRAAAFPP